MAKIRKLIGKNRRHKKSKKYRKKLNKYLKKRYD